MLLKFQQTLLNIKIDSQTWVTDGVDIRYLYDLLPLIGLFFTRPLDKTLEYLGNWIFSIHGKELDEILEEFYNEDGSVIRGSNNIYTHLFNVNKTNPYVNTYRDKYTWENFKNSILSGLLLSRLYIGSWNPTLVTQDFKYRSHPQSLGSYLGKFPINVFTGSSYAAGSILDSLRLSKLARINIVQAVKVKRSTKVQLVNHSVTLVPKVGVLSQVVHPGRNIAGLLKLTMLVISAVIVLTILFN